MPFSSLGQLGNRLTEMSGEFSAFLVYFSDFLVYYAPKVTRKEQLLMEIEAAAERHAGVKSRIEQGGETPELMEHLKTAESELATLRNRYLKIFLGQIQ